MSIRSVIANLRCDRCDGHFSLALDPAGKCPADEIHDMLTEGTATEEPGRGFAKMKGGKMLCPGCSGASDGMAQLNRGL